ncbi:LysM peptidoglycan-binding domain-containing protein [Sunxiuqinia sp. A32]|uniref:LysM peptidoglycan-binding domain-containing protein n=1 Tax=Sunxiuqinia sp. A32 TaxID=3461496 RepID=UPI0040464AD1
MKNFILLICCLFLLNFVVYSQEKTIRENGQTFLIHQVEKGETIFSLTKKYEVDQKELLNANPNLIFGLKVGQELKIPVDAGVVESKTIEEEQPVEREPIKTFHSYRVRKNNTLHFIAKRYDVTIEDIEKYNPEVKDGLKKGMVLSIPDARELQQWKEQQAKVAEQKEGQMVTHQVVGDETLYSISKKYDRSISSILKLNPKLEEGLKIGMKIQIPATKEAAGPVSQVTNQDGFFIHLVESGETFWRLQREFGTSRAELIEYNPVLEQGLMAGLRIKIPARHIPDVKVTTDESRYDQHLVSKGETLYGLAIAYDTRISELKKANPVLEYRGLIAGETINVPRKESIINAEPTEDLTIIEKTAEQIVGEKEESAEQFPVAGCTPDFTAAFDTYDVGLLLPLYLEANDTVNHIKITPKDLEKDTLLRSQFEAILETGRDTFKVRDEKIIYPRSENFMQFYEGVLLAVDSLQEAGMRVNLHVFDTNQDQQVIDSLLHLDIFRELDLIIGPVFPNLQGIVADYSSKNRIPMVSPLSSGGNFELNNPYYFKVNPNKEYLVRKTASYLTEEYFDKNIIVMQMGEYKHLPEATLVDLCREKFFSTGFNSQSGDVLFHEYDFQEEGYWGLTRIASKDRENVFIIPSENEGQVSVGITNLNALSEEYPVTLVGMSNFQRYQSIQPEYYHHTKLHLLSPYFVDYESLATNRFIGRFRENYYAEPNQFSFQGYDVAFYFMSALYRYGKDFVDCLPGHRVELTQGDFFFEPQSRFGGFMNEGLFVVSYDPDYSVVDEGTIAKPAFQLVEQ